MLRVTTLSGSVYEIDTENKRARRVSGDVATESKNAADGDWRNYVYIDGPIIGQRLNIFWDGKLTGKARSTSPVTDFTDESLAVVEN